MENSWKMAFPFEPKRNPESDFNETQFENFCVSGPGLKDPETRTLDYVQEVAVQTAKFVYLLISYSYVNGPSHLFSCFTSIITFLQGQS